MAYVVLATKAIILFSTPALYATIITLFYGRYNSTHALYGTIGVQDAYTWYLARHVEILKSNAKSWPYKFENL